MAVNQGDRAKGQRCGVMSRRGSDLRSLPFSCCAIRKILRRGELCFIDLVRKPELRFEAAAASWTLPNMAGVAIAQVFRPFRRDQLASALNAVHPKGRAKFGFHRHGVTLPLAPKRWREELSVLWQPTHFDLIYVVGISLGVITQKTQHATRSRMGPRDCPSS